MPKKKKSIADTIADAVEKEIKKDQNQIPEEREERSLDEELDFYNPNFGDIKEEDYDD
jgi:hypothetical protein